MTVVDGFAHCHNVRYDALCFKCPEMCPDAPEASLYLVGDTNAARGTCMAKRFLEIMRWEHDLTAASEQRLTYESGHVALLFLYMPDGFLHITRVLFACLWIVLFELPPVGIGHRYNLHMGRLSRAAWTIEFIRADVDQRAGIAMIGHVYHNH